jgi:hypothetical protein
MTKKRVIAWGTGSQGRPGLRSIMGHPDLELVGAHAYSPEKLGRDASEFVGLAPSGVAFTNNVEELLALDADCVVYFATAANRQDSMNEDIIPFLERGTNVSTVSHFDLQYAKHGAPELVDPVRQACERGGSSILLTGEDPGFGFGQHLFCLLSAAGRIDGVEMIETSNVRNYAGRGSLEMYGFNGDPAEMPPMFTSQVGASWHLATLRGIADYLRVEIDGFEQKWENEALDFDFETAAFGMASAGRTAATLWTVQAIVAGRPFLTYKKVLRLHEEAGKDWPQTALGKNGQGITYKIKVSGDPDYECETHRPAGSASQTPILAVNAVPFVCDAEPGIIEQTQIPLFPPRNLSVPHG